jgi:hypothetical protein
MTEVQHLVATPSPVPLGGNAIVLKRILIASAMLALTVLPAQAASADPGPSNPNAHNCSAPGHNGQGNGNGHHSHGNGKGKGHCEGGQYGPAVGFSISKNKAAQNDTLQAEGSGCEPNTQVVLTLQPGNVALNNYTAKKDSTFKGTFKIAKNQPVGNYTVQAKCGALTQTAPLQVVPFGTKVVFTSPADSRGSTVDSLDLGTKVAGLLILALAARALIVTKTGRRRTTH